LHQINIDNKLRSIHDSRDPSDCRFGGGSVSGDIVPIATRFAANGTTETLGKHDVEPKECVV
jgi:hypothetical protein